MLINRIKDQEIIKNFLLQPEIWDLISSDSSDVEGFKKKELNTTDDYYLGWFSSAEEAVLKGILIAHRTPQSDKFNALEVHLNVLPQHSKEAHVFTHAAQKILKIRTKYLYCEVPECSPRTIKFIERDHFYKIGVKDKPFIKNSTEYKDLMYLKTL
jgi:hypothetical protein